MRDFRSLFRQLRMQLREPRAAAAGSTHPRRGGRCADSLRYDSYHVRLAPRGVRGDTNCKLGRTSVGRCDKYT